MTKEELYLEIGKLEPEMSSTERMIKYLKGEKVDCQPYSTMTFDAVYCQMYGFNPENLNDFDFLCEIIKRKQKEYGVNELGASMTLRTVGEALGSKVYYPKGGKTEYITEHFMKSYEQLDELQEMNVRTNRHLKGIVDNVKRLKERFPDMPITSGCPGPISAAASVRAIELILRDVRRNPENLHKLLELCVVKCLEWLEYLKEEVGCVSASIFDPVTSTDVLGKKYYLEFSKPYFKRLYDGMTEALGVSPSVHICGHTKGIWEDIIEIGVKNFSVDDREDIGEVKKCIGNKVMIVGNVSPVNIMRNGTIDEVIDEVKRQLMLAADSPMGYIISPGCEVPLGTPKENLDAYIYAVRKYGAEAQLGCLPKGLKDNRSKLKCV